MTFYKKNLYLSNKFLDDTLFYSLCTFTCIRQHCFSKYWGTDAWAVPPPQILGDRPPSPLLSLRPCHSQTHLNTPSLALQPTPSTSASFRHSHFILSTVPTRSMRHRLPDTRQ